MSGRLHALGLLVIFAVAAAVVVPGCADDDGISREVGATCERPDECAAICLRPADGWPGGMCTVPCAAERDCPGDTSCVAEAAGACLYRCSLDGDCALLQTTAGVGWVCRDRATPVGSMVRVCVGP